MRDDFLQPDPAERREAALKRTLERVDMIYGRLDEAQRKLIVDGIGPRPSTPRPGWPSACAASATRADAAPAGGREGRPRPRGGALRALAERTERSPDPAYRAYQQRLTDYNCGFAARIHNAMSPAQRLAARDRLKGWEDDLRALAAAAPDQRGSATVTRAG
jgi:hypothetical protein